MARFTGEAIGIRAASRTDSGAHAIGQMVDFPTFSVHPVETFPKALNYYLPPDIRVQAAYEVAPDFHSRRDAFSRTYRYQILNRYWPSALRRHTCFWVREWLDASEMTDAAQGLVGCHDFRPLATGHPVSKSAIRRVYRWDVWRDGDMVMIECEANGFLRHQIRRANALLVEIGKGRWSRDMVNDVLGGNPGGKVRWSSVPALGLCLMKVTYPALDLPADTSGEAMYAANAEQRDAGEARYETD